MIIGNDSILGVKCRPLRFEHFMVHQQAVGEHDGFTPAAGFLVKQLNSVHAGQRHACTLSLRGSGYFGLEQFFEFQCKVFQRRWLLPERSSVA